MLSLLRVGCSGGGGTVSCVCVCVCVCVENVFYNEVSNARINYRRSSPLLFALPCFFVPTVQAKRTQLSNTLTGWLL